MFNFFGCLKDKYDDFMDCGTRLKCPNCNKRTILQYPTITCGHCEAVFHNNIQPKPAWVSIKCRGCR